MGVIEKIFRQGLLRRVERVASGDASQQAEAQASKLAADRLALGRVRPPQGASRVGDAVNRAILKADSRTVPVDKVFTSGVIDEVWLNDLDEHNEAMANLAELIRKEISPKGPQELVLQSFAIYGDSQAAQDVFKAIAEKQRVNPQFKLFLLHNKDYAPQTFYSIGVDQALAQHGVQAHVAEHLDLPSTYVNHAKSYILNRRIGVLGGNNLQSAAEQDLLVKVHGPVVDTMVHDAHDAWKAAKFKYFFDGKRRVALPAELPAPSRIPTPAPKGAVPMTFLSKGDKDSLNSDANVGILTALRSGRRLVKIKGPNINAKEVYEAAKDAAQGGSKVQLLLSRENNKYKSILSGGNNRQIVRKLNKLPPEIRKNIEIRWFATPADGVKSAEERIAKAHTKYYSVDGQWHYLGSQNPDHVSFHTSREIGIGVDDAKATAKMDRILFDNDWENAVPADPGHFWEL